MDITNKRDHSVLGDLLKDRKNLKINYKVLFEHFYSRIYRSFPGRIQPSIREDLTQEVFIRVYRNIGRAPADEEGFKRWIHLIAKNVYRNWVRYLLANRRRTVQVPLRDVDHEPGEILGSDYVELQAIRSEEKQLLYQAIQRLPLQQRYCILLKVVGDLSVPEIAGLLEISSNTVKTHLKAAKRSLRSDLGRVFGGWHVA